MAAISVMVVILWVTEAIPLAIAALLGPALAVLFAVSPAKQAFAPFSHPLIFLFLGGFMLAEALRVQGVDRRAALWMLSRRVIAGSPTRALMGVTITAYLFSMWISNTATTAMMVPIALGLCATIGEFSRDIQRPRSDRGEHTDDVARRFDEGMLISLAYGASLGGVATPIGTAPNIVALGALEGHTHIDFLQWMAFATPISLCALVGLLIWAAYRFPPVVRRIPGLRQQVRNELTALGPLRTGERRVLGIFVVTVLAWLTPSLLRLSLGEESPITLWARNGLKEGVVAILGASVLFMVPAKKSPHNEARLLSWSDAASIDWGTLFLLGGGLAMGNLVFETGLAKAIAEVTVGQQSDPGATLFLLAASTILVLYMTELTSNTATTSMMIPVLIPVAQRAGVDPVPVTIIVAIAASFAFMLPVSTPPNAIVYGTGRVRLGSMIRFGAWLDIAAIVLLVASGYWFLPLFQLGE